MNSLLKLQIGPVQEFIAQARSTRDLWSGSYLLSWLMAAGLHHLKQNGNEIQIIYPNCQDQPVLKLFSNEQADPDLAHVPSLPNVLLAIVSGSESEANNLAKATAQAIQKEWEDIAEKVWNSCNQNQFPVFAAKARFESQIQRFPSIAWKVTPDTKAAASDWGQWTKTNRLQLDAVKRTHAFNAWGSGGWLADRYNNKDSLTGQDEAVMGGPKWRDNLSAESKKIFKHDDWLGAITLVKRVWHRAYLSKRGLQDFRMPNTPGIAAHDPFAKKPEHDEDNPVAVEQLPESETYFAVLALDGDNMGDYIRSIGSHREHAEFSHDLSQFALKQAGPLVADSKHEGYLIYAGGDDVLALLPADTALTCAHALREKFRRVMRGLDVSAGIAIAHFKSPLQDIVRAARLAEEHAKEEPKHGGLGRSAVAVTLFKRSGETVKWGCRWDEGGLALYFAVADALARGRLSAKFPQRVIELLNPYLMEQTGLANSAPAPGFETVVDEIIEREVASVCDRQRGPGWTPEVPQQLLPLLKTYVSRLPGAEQKVREIIGLCQTVAFARIRDRKDNLEPQT